MLNEQDQLQRFSLPAPYGLSQDVFPGQILTDSDSVFCEDNMRALPMGMGIFDFSPVPTAQNIFHEHESDIEGVYEELTQTLAYSLPATLDNNIGSVDCSVYGSTAALASDDFGSPNSSVASKSSTAPSFLSVHGLSPYQKFYTDFLVLLNSINLPTSRTYPCDWSSQNTSESSNTSPVSVSRLGAVESAPDPISTCPEYPTSIYEAPVDALWNTSVPHSISPPSPAYKGYLGRASENFCIGEGNHTVDETHEMQGISVAISTTGNRDSPKLAPNSNWCASQGIEAVAIIPAEHENMQDHTNPQQICNEQSGWVVDFFCEEGIEPITLNSDHTTGAGPSTGSGVAAAMLDIEQAQEGQRRHDGVASVSAAPTEQMGNGKRKAEDALDAPEASKRLRLEPSAQSIGDIASTQSAEASASNSGNFYQKSITEYRHVFASDETNGNEGLQSKDSTFMMFKHEQDGTLTRLHTVLARDCYVRSRRIAANHPN